MLLRRLQSTTPKIFCQYFKARSGCLLFSREGPDISFFRRCTTNLRSAGKESKYLYLIDAKMEKNVVSQIFLAFGRLKVWKYVQVVLARLFFIY